MRTTVAVSLAASAAAVLLAGCGGGGGGSNNNAGGGGTQAPAALQISGTAATGLALANSSVAVQCSTGSGTATTLTDGTYSLSISGGALPCVIQVTGEADGTTVTLHSVTEADAGSTSVVANVTPLTEMIVAQLTGALPSDVFSTLESGGTVTVTKEQLNAATTAVVTALKDATGIDLTAIDPFKTQLVAATATAPTQGNDYDKLLDKLKESVPTETLPLVVNQIASAAATTTSGDTTTEAEGKVTLTEVMKAVDGGSLPGCPQAVSGKYRTIDYFGRTFVRQIDFKAKKFNRGDGQPLFDITFDPEKPCEFTVAGTFNGVESHFDVVIGPQGAGTYKSVNVTNNRATMGYIFPVQAHPVSAIAGEWTFLQSGRMPDEPVPVRHFLGKMSFSANNKVGFCDYNTSNWVCEAPSEPVDEEVRAASDGGFRINDVGAPVEESAPMYAYRSPAGTLTLFGTTNPAGATGETVEQTHFIAARLAKQALPAVGTVAKYWDVMLRPDTDADNALNLPSSITFSANSNTVTTVDEANRTVSRTRASDGRVDTVRLNAPLEGMRFRPPVTGAAGLYYLPFPGLGLTTYINGAPSTSTFHIYGVSAGRQ